MLVDQSKLFLVVREICPPRRSCRSRRSSKACAEPDQPIDRSNRSVATARNGRRAIYGDGPRRILSGQSDMTGCAPASRCTMGTSYRLTGCEGPKRRQHAVLRAAPAAIFGWLVLVSVPKPCFSGAVPLPGVYLVAGGGGGVADDYPLNPLWPSGYGCPVKRAAQIPVHAAKPIQQSPRTR